MKCCLAFSSLLLFPLLIDGQRPDYVDESVARINEDLESTWGRGSVGRWRQSRWDESPNFRVRLLRPDKGFMARALQDHVLPTEVCGMQHGSRIFHGEVASMDEFPWLARLFYQNEYRCGGSLISKDFVLTAAHCVPVTLDAGPLLTFIVVLGEYDLSRAQDCDARNCATTTTVRVQTSLRHEKFKQGYFDYDIALLKLARSVQYRRNIVPICLPVYGETESLDSVDTFLIAGWGRTEEDEFPDVKRYAELARADVDQCSEAHGRIRPELHVCAGGREDMKDSCEGDSGGPLMAVGKVNGTDRYIAVGVLSNGPEKCGTPGIPGVYEKVSAHVSWIMDNISR